MLARQRLSTFLLALVVLGLAPSEVQLASDEAKRGTNGLLFVLAEGVPDKPAREVSKTAPATKLDAKDAERLLARVPKIREEAGDEKSFALRKSSLPPPQTGKKIEEPFPPKTRPDAAGPTGSMEGPLEVVRHQPEGEVPLAPNLSVTFSEPMVAVTSFATLEKEKPPVTITPEPPGKWRWIGAKTVLFEPEHKFPMATVYKATVPAGVRSKSGVPLKKGLSWTFSTPPAEVKAFHPQGGTQPVHPIMIATFDQSIDPEAVLHVIHVSAGNRRYPAELVSGEDLAKDQQIKSMADGAGIGRFLAFRTKEPFPPATDVVVSIGPDVPSREGPRTSDKASEHRFRTYDPFKMRESRCGWSPPNCTPGTPFSVWFNNAIDPELFDPSAVKIKPEIPGANITASGAVLTVSGRTKGRTKYEVIVPASLTDVFGQTLKQEARVHFDVGSAPPSLFANGQDTIVLDPATKPALAVYSTNYPRLQLRIWSVAITDRNAYLRAVAEARNATMLAPPGKKVKDGVLQIADVKDEMVETSVDLSPYLKDGLGHLIIDVRPSPDLLKAEQRMYPPRITKWVEATRIGIDAFVDASEMHVWATDLSSGEALNDAEVRVLPHGMRAKAGEGGLATFELPASQVKGGGLVVVKRGADEAFLAEHIWGYSDSNSWFKTRANKAPIFYIFDDRGLYRPGEEAHVKGWIRRVDYNKGGDVEPAPEGAKTLRYTLNDSRGNTIKKGTSMVNALGGFSFDLKLPDTMNLGSAQLVLEAQGGVSAWHAIRVEEFRRPEFEVSASAGEGPHIVGRASSATVRATYYAGGGLAGADTVWNVTASPSGYTPPNRGDYVFGVWTPWWYASESPLIRARGVGGIRRVPSPQAQIFTGKTDASGEHRLSIAFSGVNPPRPMSVSLQATVMDVNRQAWAASTSMLVHPSSLYVGLKTERPYVREKEPIKVDAIAVDIDGKAITGRAIDVRSARLEWRQTKGKWGEEEVDEKTCKLTSKTDAVRCELGTGEGGRYRVRATIKDDRGRDNESELTIWVAGGKWPAERNVVEEKAELIPDKKTYAIGDVAEIMVRSPFFPAEGLLTVRRSGIVHVERFSMKESTALIHVPIEEGYLPNVLVSVALDGSAPRTDDQGTPIKGVPRRPAFALGTIDLSVPPISRALTVIAAPKMTALEPGGTTDVLVTVTGADKKPVHGAEVALVIVDESVLALSGFKLPDPLELFYPRRTADVREQRSRALVVLPNPEQVKAEAQDATGAKFQTAAPAPEEPMPGTKALARAAAKPLAAFGGEGASDKKRGPAPIALRTDFSALAMFAPELKTDAEGRAKVTVKMPDNLTRYRVMAVAVAGAKQFGLGESSITARKALMVRPSAPRFLNFGDRFELPVVVQNQTKQPMSVDLAVRATNARLLDGEGRRVTVPAEDRVEVRFPAGAQLAGTARFQLVGASGDRSDAAEISLPVWTPATTEAFATYGEIDRGALIQPITTPSEVVKEFGGVEINTASTELQSLTDAVLNLVSYPYECSEQISSRLLAIAALKDVLGAFEAKGMPDPKSLLAAVDRDIKRLKSMQNYDGGFAFWKKGDETWPFNSIHAAHALARAKAKGFTVPEDMTGSVMAYLKSIESHYPSTYPQEIRRTLTAYALYVRALYGDRDSARARKLIVESGGTEKMSLEALGWLYPVLIDDGGSVETIGELRRLFNNRVSEEAGTAHFASSYSDGAYLLLHSDRRADALILDGLIRDQPKSDLIPKIVRGLLAHRTAGHWSSTQEDVWVLLALDRYFHTFEKTTPNFVARAWLGKDFAGEHKFRGRTTEIDHLAIPMSALASGDKTRDLVLDKEGEGRLYYRIGMRYAPASLKLDPSEHGFTVTRTYEAIDDERDVRKDEAGVWHIKSGARVRVRVDMVATTRRYHVALVDPLPAGLEPMNPALAVTGKIPADEKSRSASGWWWWAWYQHQNMRDDRVEAFTTLLWEGVHDYVYVARATTPGEFIVPPSKAEEMYHPETFGRSASDRVIVE
jgi:uncharacterized protein YfaS (alpha-2-macroglobulin family)